MRGLGIVLLFFPQHILKITHGHLLIEQYSLGKAVKGESKHALKVQYTDCVLSPLENSMAQSELTELRWNP